MISSSLKGIYLNFSRGKNDYDYSVWEEILSFLVKQKIESIGLIGYHKDQRKIIEFLKNKNIKVYYIQETKAQKIDLDIPVYCVCCDFNYIDSYRGDFLIHDFNLKTIDFLLDGNIEKLINKTKKFKGTLFGLENQCLIHHSCYWRNRTAIKEKDLWNVKDRKKILKFINLLKKHKTQLKILNSNESLNDFANFGLTQNWKCKFINNIVINADGSLSPCFQKDYLSPVSIFDVMYEGKKIITNHVLTSRSCDGCFQTLKLNKEML